MGTPRDLLVALGAAIRELRTERGLTQEELSVRTGMHRNYIGGIERGERAPTVTTTHLLATALGVSMTELFRRVEGEPD